MFTDGRARDVYKRQPIDAVTEKTVLAGESSDFHVRKLGSAELIAKMCPAFQSPYSP